MFQTDAFEHLTLGGPEPVVRALEATLHPYLRDRLCGRIAVGVSAGMGEIREAVLDVEREVERQREAEAVDRLRQAVASGQRAVVGLAPTVLAAVSEHRVDRLLVSPGYAEAGWTLWRLRPPRSGRAPLPGCARELTAGRRHRRAGGRGGPGPVLPRGDLRRQSRPRRDGAHRRPAAVLTRCRADRRPRLVAGFDVGGTKILGGCSIPTTRGAAWRRTDVDTPAGPTAIVAAAG